LKGKTRSWSRRVKLHDDFWKANKGGGGKFRRIDLKSEKEEPVVKKEDNLRFKWGGVKIKMIWNQQKGNRVVQLRFEGPDIVEELPKGNRPAKDRKGNRKAFDNTCTRHSLVTP